MSVHALFAPSAAHRWLNCPGSFAFVQNTEQDDSSEYADDGTASHALAAWCFLANNDAARHIGQNVMVRDKAYPVDEERAAYVQVYVDEVRRRKGAGLLLIEKWLKIPEFGDDQGGTPDAVIITDSEVAIVDLKYGVGEKVYARGNAQGLSYLLGARRLAELYGEPQRFTFVIVQPRLGHIDEWTFSQADLDAFAEAAQRAIVAAGVALTHEPTSADVAPLLHPDTHTCRWCRAKAYCPALRAQVDAAVGKEFDAVTGPKLDLQSLSTAAIALPIVKMWCGAVEAELWQKVSTGAQVTGPDGQPFKLVAGKEGFRKWADETAAESALLGQLADKAYQPKKIITAPSAAKLLDKKQTKQLWQDVFEPLITRAPGRPELVQGSDPRPPFTGAAEQDEFKDEITA